MFDSEKFDDLVNELLEGLPPMFGEARDEFKKNLRARLETLIQKMNLVSREEYDIQVELLERLRKRVATLEKRLHPTGSDAGDDLR